MKLAFAMPCMVTNRSRRALRPQRRQRCHLYSRCVARSVRRLIVRYTASAQTTSLIAHLRGPNKSHRRLGPETERIIDAAIQYTSRPITWYAPENRWSRFIKRCSFGAPPKSGSLPLATACSNESAHSTQDWTAVPTPGAAKGNRGYSRALEPRLDDAARPDCRSVRKGRAAGLIRLQAVLPGTFLG